MTKVAWDLDLQDNIVSNMVLANQVPTVEWEIEYNGTSKKVRFHDGTASTDIIDETDKGIANWVASLDWWGKVPISQLPTSGMEFLWNRDASTNTPTLANTDTDKQGNVYRTSVAWTVDFWAGNITFWIWDRVYNTGTIWEKWDNTDAVASVNSQIWVVVLDADDISDAATTNKFVTAGDLTNLWNLSGTNTWDVTVSWTPDYITIVWQTITRNAIDMTTDITGITPIANGGTWSATQNFVDLTTAQTVWWVKTLSDTLESNTTTADDNLKLEKSNSTTSWTLNAGRVAFFDNRLLFKNSGEAGNYTFAVKNTGQMIGKDGSAWAPTFSFDNASNYGMSYDGGSSELVLSASGQPMIRVDGDGTTKRVEIKDDSLLKLPDMVTTTRDTLTPVDGDIIYNNTTDTIQGRVNGAWTDLWGAKNNWAYYISTQVTTTISTVNTPVKISGTTTAMWTATNATIWSQRITIPAWQTAKEYSVLATISAYWSSAKQYTFYIAKNWTIQPWTGIARDLENNALKAWALSTQWKGSLTATDYIEVWAENNEDSSNLEVISMQVVLQEM